MGSILYNTGIDCSVPMLVATPQLSNPLHLLPSSAKVTLLYLARLAGCHPGHLVGIFALQIYDPFHQLYIK